MAGTLLFCGNGLSIDYQSFVGGTLHPSEPFCWDVPNPSGAGSLLQAMPKINAWIDEISQARGAEVDCRDLFHELVNQFSKDPSPYAFLGDVIPGQAGPVREGTDGPSTARIHVEARHFLAIAFSWFQSRLDVSEAKMTSWPWYRWIDKHAGIIRAVLSLNYDLIVERALKRSRIPFQYPSELLRADRKSKQLLRRGTPVPVCKPHGSCNFASQLDVGERGYPMRQHAWLTKAPLRPLRDHELMTARGVVDMIVPGESNNLRQHHKWIAAAEDTFLSSARFVDTLVVAGFSYSKCDQKEFGRLFALMPRIKRTFLVDPSPSNDLRAALEQFSEKVVVADGPPQI